jgi:two-component system response regulator YesN
VYKVLLVDDEPSILRMLRELVQWTQYGFSVCAESGNGKDALENMKIHTPDLVITDIRMPLIDGLEFIQQSLKGLNSKATFIIVSGYDDFEVVRASFKLGVKDYLLKPLDIDDLVDVLIKVATELEVETHSKEQAALSLSRNDREAFLINEIETSNNQNVDLMDKIKKYVDENYKKPISLKSIAEEFYINPVYLGQILKKKLDMYFNEYLQLLRIEEAKRLLRTTNMKISVIASTVGYRDKDYFAIKFEEVVKQKLSEYRKAKDMLGN